MVTNYRYLIFLLFLIFYTGFSSYSQIINNYSKDLQVIAKPGSNKERIKFKEGLNIAPHNIFVSNKEAFNLSEDDNMRLFKESLNSSGFKHLKFQQYYKGLKVYGYQYLIHVNKQGELHSANGQILHDISINTIPSLSKEEAVIMTLPKIDVGQHNWDSEFMENELTRQSNNPDTSYYPSPELIIFSTNHELGEARLSYKIDLHGSVTSIRVFVDAQTGEILKQLPLVANCDPTTVNTIFNGTKNINTDNYAVLAYKLIDDCHATEINVQKWTGSLCVPIYLPITSSNNTWTNDNQRFGGSVLWAIKESNSYFLDRYGRNSFDNADHPITARINAKFRRSSCSPGSCGAECTSTDNASMSFTTGIMNVGLGSDGDIQSSYCPLDIIAHEFTHAVTWNETQLDYDT